MSDTRYTPFYGCVLCGEDVGTPADELRLLPNGDIICRNCYEQDNPPEAGEWGNLPAFIPELAEENAVLVALLKPVFDALEKNMAGMCDCDYGTNDTCDWCLLLPALTAALKEETP